MFVALSTIRNGSLFLEYWLRKISLFVDAHVVNNDCSSDNTLEILNKLKDELNIEIINSEIPIQHSFKNDFENNAETTKYSNDYIVYTKLLEAGRRIGGTIFFRPSLDELPSSNFYKNGKNGLKSITESLREGEGISLKWNDVLDKEHNMRNDHYGQSMHQQYLFKDGLEVSYKNVLNFTGDKREYGILSIPIPIANLKTITDNNYSILHFQYISFSDTLIKHYHYKLMDCLLGKEGSRMFDIDTLNSTFDQFTLPLLDRVKKQLPDECFSLYEDLDYTMFIGWQDYRIRLIEDLIITHGFEKVSKVYACVPIHNPIVWGRTNWTTFYVKDWNDFDKYLQIVSDVREQDYKRNK